jgi:8-oxo-dGTP pyrophosphatase MutT (NUDIX family)
VRREFSAGGVLVRRLQGRWMMAAIRPRRDGTPVWALPKGHIDPGESAAASALREAREETGLDVELIAELGTVQLRDDKQLVDLHLFAVRARAASPRWERHRNRDTFVVRPDQVAAHLSSLELRAFWEEYWAGLGVSEAAPPKRST